MVVCASADNHCEVSNPTRQTSEYACDFTSEICGQTGYRCRRGRCPPITADRENSISVCRNLTFILSGSAQKQACCLCRGPNRQAVQIVYAETLQSSTRLGEPGCWPPSLARHTRSPAHHAAGTLPASGTREGTTPEQEAHFSYAYMTRPL